jgi:rhodanese-related sulfurtransferase
MTLEEIMEGDVAIIDVRTPMEFMGGHVSSSMNIPLQEIMARATELKELNKPLVLCCATGNRSGQAAQALKQWGIPTVYNAGSWLSVNAVQSQKIRHAE